MGKYRQKRYAPTKFRRPVAASAGAKPMAAVSPAIIAGATATPPDVSMRKEARNSFLDPPGARSAPRIIFMPAESAFASDVTAARIQKLVRSVTINAKRYVKPRAKRVGTEDQNFPNLSITIPER